MLELSTQSIQHKDGNVLLKSLPVHGHKEETAMHGAGGRSQVGARGVLEGLPRFQKRLMPHHPEALDTLVLALGIVDVPGARDQLRAHLTHVGDGDGVTEHIDIILWLRLIGQVLGHHFNFYFVFAHGAKRLWLWNLDPMQQMGLTVTAHHVNGSFKSGCMTPLKKAR